MKIALIFVALQATLVSCYLTEQSQAHLKGLASKKLTTASTFEELA
jgi:hypothetical protein